jgi:hypothetical protein
MNKFSFEYAEGSFDETRFRPLILAVQYWFLGGAKSEPGDLLACPTTREPSPEAQLDAYAQLMKEGTFCTCIMNNLNPDPPTSSSNTYHAYTSSEAQSFIHSISSSYVSIIHSIATP